MPDATLLTLMRAIAARDQATASRALAASPALARAALTRGATRQAPAAYFLADLGRHLYQGDTALHVAAAAQQVGLARELLALGADVHAGNRRGAQPLHHAADGGPGSPGWAPSAQAEMVALLLEAGALPDAVDRSGVAPLHRAVRCRCALAVQALLEGGADPRKRNGAGSTPLELASRTTGRGGSGSAEARAQQAEILRLLARATPRRGR